MAAGSGARFEVKMVPMVLIGLVRALNRLLIGKIVPRVTSLRQIGEKFYVPTMMVPACRSADVTEFLGGTTRPDESKLGSTCLVLAAVEEST